MEDSFTSLVCKKKVVMGMDGPEWGWKCLHIEALIPIWVQSLLDDAGGVGLVCIHRNDSEWVWETGGFTLGQSICGNNSGEM